MKEDFTREHCIEGRFKDQVFVITGAAGGIGKETALRAAKEGAKLVLADKKEELSKETLEEIKKITPNVEFLITDLRFKDNCEMVIKKGIDKFGKIDVLVNNAGVTGTPAPVDQMSEEMFRFVIDSNIMSTFFCSHFAIPKLIENGGGAIINVASVAGLTGFPGHCAYVTSKHGLNGLTRNMALDYATRGIRVNSVNPGTTDTPMYHEALDFLKAKREKNKGKEDSIVSGKTVSAQKRVALAKEVSDVILFLASDEASSITGTFVPVDGGFTAY
ncbi:MAG: SDR family NAD(P)-dependent oxidoreductase [Clostridium sp.]